MKKEPKWNSWVANGALETVQMDIAHMPFNLFGASKYKYALFAYDVFSKKLTVYPLENQNSESTANALKQLFEEDMGLPLSVYTDEGGEFVKNFEKELKYYDVEHKISRTPPAFVERAIRTVKEKILNRPHVGIDKSEI